MIGKSTVALLVASAMFAYTSAERLSRAHVIVTKTLAAPETKDYLVQGKPFEITYNVINLGEETAYDVAVHDVFPSSSFDIVQGKSSFAFPTLEAGKNQTNLLTVIPKVAGTFTVARAEIKYRAHSSEENEEDEELEGENNEDNYIEYETSSSSPGRVEILRNDVYDRVSSTHSVQLVVVYFAALGLILAPYLQFRAVRVAGLKQE